jgi:peptidyl-prolyl cis-trans isomerase SurA
VGSANAQEIIKDSVKTVQPIKSSKKVKVDGIIATVGDYIVLDSDIDKSFFLYLIPLPSRL